MKDTPSKILIVDDELSICMKLAGLLHDQQYDIHILNSGQALLDCLPNEAIDLILLDVVMPDLDGFEVCRRIKTNPLFQHIPIILVTALEGKKVLMQGLEAGADDFLQKPVQALELRTRVRSMLRIKKQYDELEATLKMREELSNMVVHDMSSPIVSILLHSTLLTEQITNSDALKHLDMIRMGADRLDSFVNDLLMMAKMEHSKLRLNLSIVDVNQLARDAEQHFGIIAQSRGISLIMELPKEPLEMYLDSNLFRRVIANLLANALQYSPANSCVRVRVRAQKGNDSQQHLSLQVIDEGMGIPEAYQQRIFEKFEVVELRKQGIRQIGLGLTFCKMAVDAHGGKIFVQTNQPKGSVFIVEI
jgi:signal transduction histidine kinase